MRLILILTTGGLVLIQLICALRLFLGDKAASYRKTVQCSTLLAILSPVGIGLLLVIGIQILRAAPFEPVVLAMPFTAPECGALCQMGGLKFFGALALMVQACMGAVGMMAVWWRIRRTGQSSPIAVITGLCLSLVAGIMGFGAYLLELSSRVIAQAFETRALGWTQTVVEELRTFGLPAWLQVTIWACIAVGSIALLAMLLRNRNRQVVERSALATGFVILAIGAVAFGFTRYHAHDIKTNLPPLIGTDDSIPYQAPRTLDTAVFGRMVPSWSQTHPKLEPNVSLPESTSAISYKWAINVAITPYDLKVEGNSIAKIKKGKLEGNRIDDNQSITGLFNLLRKFQQIQAKETVNLTGDETIVALQVDQGVPFGLFDQVVKTASQAGYPHFRLVVQNKLHTWSWRTQRVGIINVSAPTICLPGDHALVKSYQADAVAVERPDPAKDTQRYARVDLQDLESETPGGQAVLELRIRPDGFFLHLREDAGKVQSHIPKKNQKYDFELLARRARQIHDQFRRADTIVIFAGRDVPYDTLIRALDATRERIIDQRLDTREHLFTNACIASLGEETRTPSISSGKE